MPTVLVVEDETLIRELIAEELEEAGYSVVVATNADQAIAILEARQDIHLVFTDIDMPGSMDGLRLVRVVRSRWPPVALIVTSGQRGLSAADLPPGGRFLSKPYEHSHLETVLRELIP